MAIASNHPHECLAEPDVEIAKTFPANE